MSGAQAAGRALPHDAHTAAWGSPRPRPVAGTVPAEPVPWSPHSWLTCVLLGGEGRHFQTPRLQRTLVRGLAYWSPCELRPWVWPRLASGGPRAPVELPTEEGGHSEPLLSWGPPRRPGLSSDRSATLPGSPSSSPAGRSGLCLCWETGLGAGGLPAQLGERRRVSTALTVSCTSQAREEETGDPQPSLGGRPGSWRGSQGHQAGESRRTASPGGAGHTARRQPGSAQGCRPHRPSPGRWPPAPLPP